MTQLLVSVRSAAEAEATLRGGAALIDVKEPERGSLGRADVEAIAAVVRSVAGRRRVSAALGELADTPDVPAEPGLAYVKWGLASLGASWQSRLLDAMRQLASHQPSCRVVAVAYADWQRAQSPPPPDVCRFAAEQGAGAFLIDTWQKDGSTLLDWLSLDAIEEMQGSCGAAGVPLALAGSVGANEIRTLLPLRPDWFAVRGAACRKRQREAEIDEGEVSRLVGLLGGKRAGTHQE